MLLRPQHGHLLRIDIGIETFWLENVLSLSLSVVHLALFLALTLNFKYLHTSSSKCIKSHRPYSICSIAFFSPEFLHSDTQLFLSSCSMHSVDEATYVHRSLLISRLRSCTHSFYLCVCVSKCIPKGKKPQEDYLAIHPSPCISLSSSFLVYPMW